MAEPFDVVRGENHLLTAYERAERRNVPLSSRQEYEAYDTKSWERTYYNDKTGGYVVTQRKRIPPEHVHQNVKDAFMKEQNMCRDLADFGYGVKHLYESPGIGSADVEISRGNHSFVEINGKTADLKELNNANNIRREAIDTFFKKKKADIIVFKFKTHDRRIENEINKLKRKGWHGIYYYAGGGELV